MDSATLIEPLLEELGEEAKQHFAQARIDEGDYEGLVPFGDVISEVFIEAVLIEKDL